MAEPGEIAPTRGPRPVPRVVVAACVAFAALGALWSVVAPLGEAPDEPAHLALVLYLADGHAYPAHDGLANPRSVDRLCRTYTAATRVCPKEGEAVSDTSYRRHPAADAPDREGRPAWDDRGDGEFVGVANQMPQHPPLYYRAMAVVLRAERSVTGGDWALAQELALLRLVNVLLLAPLPLFAWWAARRFGLDRPGALVAMAALFAVPMLTHIGSTLNNDNLLILFGAALAPLLAGVAVGDRSLRSAGLIGLLCGLALLTKASAVVLPVAAVLAYLAGGVGRPAVGAQDLAGAAATTLPGDDGAPGGDVRAAAGASRLTARLLGTVRPVVVVGAVTLLVAGWWYVGVRRRTGSFTPTIEDLRLSSRLRPPGFDPDPLSFAGVFVSRLNLRFWGSFGWFTIRFPGWLAVLASTALLVVVVVALLPSTRTVTASVLARLSLLAPFTLLGAFVLARAWSLHVRTGTYQFIQGRYLFAGLVGVVVLFAVGMRRLAPRWGSVAVLGFAVFLQGEALRRAFGGWWGGPGVGPAGQVRAMIAWSGWPAAGPILLVLAAAVAGTWLVVEVARTVGEVDVAGGFGDGPDLDPPSAPAPGRATRSVG